MRRLFAASRTVPAWLSGQALLEWISLPSISTSPAPSPLPAGDRSSVSNSWGGATLRSSGSWLLAHGGGHANYAGNEIYGLRLSAASPVWARLWGPTPNGSVNTTDPYYNDGNPASQHTYYFLQYDNARDELLRMRGGTYTADGANLNIDVWRWSVGPSQGWNSAIRNASVSTTPDGIIHSSGGVVASCFAAHPTASQVWMWSRAERGVWDGSSWSAIADVADPRPYNGPMVFDSSRNCLWVMASEETAFGPGQVVKWDLTTNVVSYETLGGDKQSSELPPASGAAYDPVNDCVWCYANDGTVWKFTPANMQMNGVTMTGSAPLSATGYDATAHGCHGAFQYVPELKGCVVIPAWQAPTFFFRTSN